MAKKPHTPEQITTFLNELNAQTDRGVAVIAAAVLDDILQLLILSRFIEIGSERKDALFEKIGAPLSLFSAKIELCFALGIITNEARLGLHLIREVRNKFAHRIEALSFDHPEVTELLETRLPSVIKNIKVSGRHKFIYLFQGIAIVLYGTLSADIRIQPISETHVPHTLGVLVQTLRVLAGQGVPESAVTAMARSLLPKSE